MECKAKIEKEYFEARIYSAGEEDYIMLSNESLDKLKKEVEDKIKSIYSNKHSVIIHKIKIVNVELEGQNKTIELRSLVDKYSYKGNKEVPYIDVFYMRAGYSRFSNPLEGYGIVMYKDGLRDYSFGDEVGECCYNIMKTYNVNGSEIWLDIFQDLGYFDENILNDIEYEHDKIYDWIKYGEDIVYKKDDKEYINKKKLINEINTLYNEADMDYISKDNVIKIIKEHDNEILFEDFARSLDILTGKIMQDEVDKAYKEFEKDYYTAVMYVHIHSDLVITNYDINSFEEEDVYVVIEKKNITEKEFRNAIEDYVLWINEGEFDVIKLNPETLDIEIVYSQYGSEFREDGILTHIMY